MARSYNNQQKKKKKKICKIVDFAVLADHRVKLKESVKKDKYLDLARELKKNLWSWYIYRKIIKGTGRLGNKRTSGDHPNIYTIENDQNTDMSAENLRRLAVTQISVKDHQLTLM